MSRDFKIVLEQGNRGSMQDVVMVDPTFPAGFFGGVYDGHGVIHGSYMAKQAALLIPQHFQALVKSSDEPEGMTPEQAWIFAYKRANESMPDDVEGGTTAATFLIDKDWLISANAGDSRIIVVGDTITQLTIDHNPAVPEEKERIEKTGATAAENMINFRIRVSRSLGDREFKRWGMIPDPFVRNYRINSTDRWLIAATDGVFQHLTNEDVADAVRGARTAREAAESVKTVALAKGNGSDNIGILVVALQNHD